MAHSMWTFKKLSRNYGTFDVDFQKTTVKSIRVFIRGILYCNKLGYKKFFPAQVKHGKKLATLSGHSLKL